MTVTGIGRFCLLVGVALLGTACPVPDDTDRSGLVVLPGAERVGSEKGFGRNGVEYRLPADTHLGGLAETLSRELANRGWRPLVRLPEPHETSSSFLDGWVCYERSPGRWARHWGAAWIGRNGDVTIWLIGQQTGDGGAQSVELSGHVIGRRSSGDAQSIPVAGGEPNTSFGHGCGELTEQADEAR